MIDIDPKVDNIYSWGICYSSRKTKNVIVKSRLAEQFLRRFYFCFFICKSVGGQCLACELLESSFLEFEVNKYINT